MDSILSALNLIPHILILVAAIQLTTKFSQAESYFILIGAITSLLSSVFFTFILRLLPTNTYEEQRGLIELVSAGSTLGFLLFGIGIFLLVKRFLDLQKK